MESAKDPVNYESFGAQGDGVTDDLPAICKAHDYANEQGLSVKTRADATYHLGRRALTARIATDTDWNTSRFTIDEAQDVEDHRASLFEIVSLLESGAQSPDGLALHHLSRDQRQVDARPEHDCFVRVEDDSTRLFIRRGLNQNAGVPQSDCFVLRRDGSIEADIDWDYEQITRLDSHPIDDDTLFVRGGVFTTCANREHHPNGYNYWSRNIAISRSNTEINGLTHYVTGEIDVGCPYSGFLNVHHCAHVTFRDCWSTGHKIYSTIGAVGKPVSMGSYDMNANNVVGFTLINCRMNHITDRTRWGVIGSNFCKDILLQDCHLSRMDTHMGVSGSYIIRRCSLGHMGLNAIGRGELIIEDSTLYGRSLIGLRPDYGSHWEGDLSITNCRWIPACGDSVQPQVIGLSNDGTHDFGYQCSMPRQIKIDGLFIDDANTPEGYEGPYLLADPDGGADADALPAKRPFPYTPCERISLRGLETASGKGTRLSPNSTLATVIEQS